jgi:UDP-glucose:(heptosyl)LPS alpha-1,3-glucosyltransferase
MQIAFCIFKYFPYGGIQRDLMKLARESLARGHRVRVYTLRWNAPLPAESAEDIDVVIAPVRALANHRLYERFAGWVREHLSQYPVDVVVGMNKMPGLDVYYAGDSCFEEKVCSQRGAFYRLLPRYRHFAAFERAVFDPSATTRILTISDQQVPQFRKHYGTPVERFAPLPPGIDIDRRAPGNAADIREAFRREFHLGDDERLLLFVGSGFKKKGLDRALLAFRALPLELYSQTRLFVIGHDNARPFRRLAERLGVADRVRFFAGRDDIPRFLFSADGLVLPAYDENAGMIIIEAMIAGLPSLVTGNCGYAHFLREAKAGIVAEEPFDQQRLNAQLIELLTSPSRQQWRANGIRLADDPSIYQLAARAVDAIELAAARK